MNTESECEWKGAQPDVTYFKALLSTQASLNQDRLNAMPPYASE
jgi:hypothetical protein